MNRYNSSKDKLHLRARAETALAYYEGLRRGAKFRLMEAMAHETSARGVHRDIWRKYDAFRKSALGALSGYCGSRRFCDYCSVEPCSTNREKALSNAFCETDAAARKVLLCMSASQATAEPVDVIKAFLDQAWNRRGSSRHRDAVKKGLAATVLSPVQNSERTIQQWQQQWQTANHEQAE
jgi:hypothetical protein